MLSFIPKCREVTELLTEHSEDQLRGWSRAGVRFHLAICPGCSCLQRQLEATREALGKLPETPPTDELKERLLRELRKPHSSE
jgi:hypothetical protein